MANGDNGWRVNRQVSLSFVLELVVLGSLIVSSWFSLQGRIDILQRDVDLLLDRQKEFCTRLDTLQERTIAQEYRLRTLEADQGLATNRHE